jgi:hypothetical protein
LLYHQVLNLTIDIPDWCGKWVLPMNEFRDGVVGAKSKNIANLRGKIPDWIRLPAAVTVPFSSFEQVSLVPSLVVMFLLHAPTRIVVSCCERRRLQALEGVSFKLQGKCEHRRILMAWQWASRGLRAIFLTAINKPSSSNSTRQCLCVCSSVTPADFSRYPLTGAGTA